MNQEEILEKAKAFDIPKQLFVNAYKLVKANAGSAGVDQQSLEDFERNLKNNLYKLWNRMSSGSYFPPPVKAVPIPKKSGGKRVLGIPTVGDRICQMVAKLVIEPEVEPHFLEDSYGYRPHKSALDALGVTRKRCWQQAWVLEFDIVGLFDNIPHDLMMRALRKHINAKWVLIYTERWLRAPMQNEDGSLTKRHCGTPQGGVISPVLSNLFLHYVFDKWMQRTYPEIKWCRYADDGLVHCSTEHKAKELHAKLKQRFLNCGLSLHPDKTKIVYCKNGNRKGTYPDKSFDFLGYTFRARCCWNNKEGKPFTNFTPAISKGSMKAMREKIKRGRWSRKTELSIEEIAKVLNPIIQGWINYYGRYTRSALYPICRYINKTLVTWMMKKFKKLKCRRTKAAKVLRRISENKPNLLAHWRIGMIGAFA